MSDRRKGPVRRRGMKVNSKQKKILLQFMADNPTIYYHRVTPNFTLDHHNAFWQNMSNVLNIFGPPRKTMDSWKKAWKDMRLRYRKTGIDLKQIINTLKSENVVNTRALLVSVEKIGSNHESAEVETMMKEHGLDSSPYESPSMSPRLKRASDALCSKIDLSKTMDVAAELGLTKLQQKLKVEVDSKTKTDAKSIVDEDCEELFLAVEEVLESDYEDTNDTSLEGTTKDDHQLKLSTKYSDSKADHSEKKLKTHVKTKEEDSLVNAEKVAASSREANWSAENVKNGGKKNTLNDVLVELRLLNEIEKEKLTMEKNFMEHQKLMMQHMLMVQKEIAKAQASLANTVKTFVDNIAFDS